MSREYVERRLAEIRKERLDQYTGARIQRRNPIGNPIGRSVSIGDERYIKPRVLQPITPGQDRHADTWIGPTVEILSFEQLLALPKIDGGAMRPGVYFLFNDQHVEYIGSSISVRTRVGQHDLDRGRDFNFDRATYLPVPWPWYMAIEALYIRRYLPRWNSTFCAKSENEGNGHAPSKAL